TKTVRITIAAVNDAPQVTVPAVQPLEVDEDAILTNFGVAVADVDATVNKAKALGGNVLMAPTVTVRNGTVAVIADPNGAGFVVQEWNK
ncbi:MAG: hypothetical protein NWS07_03115, partial [Desulfobacterales bacterium]|nr:hypothetical protein [Desulfobacterales bacterium]